MLVPTMKLRLIEAYEEKNEKTAYLTRRNWPECGDSFFKLQQYYHCDSGNSEGEWVDVEIDYSAHK